MEKLIDMLIGMAASKPINVTVNVYNGLPGTTSLEPVYGKTLEGDECGGDCDCCELCFGELEDLGAKEEDFDEIIDCGDCLEAKYLDIWNTLKSIIDTVPNSVLKAEILSLMKRVEYDILG